MNSVEIAVHLHAEEIETRLLWASIIGDNRPVAAVKFEGCMIYFASSAQIAQLQDVLTEAAMRLESMKAELDSKAGKA